MEYVYNWLFSKFMNMSTYNDIVEQEKNALGIARKISRVLKSKNFRDSMSEFMWENDIIEIFKHGMCSVIAFSIRDYLRKEWISSDIILLIDRPEEDDEEYELGKYSLRDFIVREFTIAHVIVELSVSWTLIDIDWMNSDLDWCDEISENWSTSSYRYSEFSETEIELDNLLQNEYTHFEIPLYEEIIRYFTDNINK